LRESDLFIEPDLTGADFSKTDLCGANLSRAELSEADLTGADLSRAELSGAILIGAKVSGADLSTASLTQEVLERATGDENTRLPADLNPPANWGVKTYEQAKEA